MPSAQSFPRHSARTQGFTLGAPRNVTVSPDGAAVLFLRSSSGTDRSNALWALDVATGQERLVADPAALLAGDEVSPAEQARRERARERASGITGYTTDAAGQQAVFALSGRAFVADVGGGSARELPVAQPVVDPRPNPGGTAVAYHCGGALRVVDVGGTGDRALAEPDGEHVSWGAAEFVAAEEMGRLRGFWWSPDGQVLLAARVDEEPVQRWYLGDPAEPSHAPSTLRYPAAGTANADVSLALLGLDGSHRSVEWDRASYPYLVNVHWSQHGPPLVAVQSRDQRTLVVLELDPATGETRERHRDTDPHWVDLRAGQPVWTPGGQLARISAVDGAYRLLVDDHPWTGPELQVRAILDATDQDVLVAASEEPTEVHVHRVGPDGAEPVTSTPGVHAASRSGKVVVLRSAGLDELHPRVEVRSGGERVAEIGSRAESPDLVPNVELFTLGRRRLRTALLLPNGYRPEHGKLPVLVDPYGGPQAQRVLARQGGYLTSQWFAEQGFAVVITDGRGMAGRDPAWERAVAGDLATPPLQDQVDALHALSEQRPELDLDRVAIRGWSFGGYLAALGVLRRPDVFHAAIAGAEVCDWRLYDTHYTERYLGDPNTDPETYERNSLLPDAAGLLRPMLIMHGTVDDNVVPAHSLRLSSALTAAARPHTVVPLPGVSHMPTDESTAENILLLQVRFLRDSLPG